VESLVAQPRIVSKTLESFVIPIMGPDRPENDRLAGVPRQEGSKTLAVAVPEFGPENDPTKASKRETPHDPEERDVDPDDVRTLVFDQVCDRLVVPIDDPIRVEIHELADAGAERLGGERLPIGLVLEGVELRPRDADLPVNRPCKRALSRPLHPMIQILGIGLLR